MPCLLDGVHPSAPAQAAETIVANRGALTNANLECDQCRRPFRPIEMADD